MQELINIFKVLGDPVRLRIMSLLSNGELCVCDLETVLKMSQPRISHHLAKLKNVNLAKDRQDGKWKYYSITNKGNLFLNNPLSEILNVCKKTEILQSDLQVLKKHKKNKKC